MYKPNIFAIFLLFQMLVYLVFVYLVFYLIFVYVDTKMCCVLVEKTTERQHAQVLLKKKTLFKNILIKILHCN